MPLTVTSLERWLPSGERPKTKPIDTLVVHHTASAGNAAAVIRYWQGLQSPNRVNAHYVVDRSGEVWKCVPTSRAAWHAGPSLGPQGKNVNGYSVGIELCNRGDGEKYPPAQYEALLLLIAELKAALPLVHVMAHHGCCMPKGRKIDPYGLDMAQLASDCGLEMAKAMPDRPDSLGV